MKSIARFGFVIALAAAACATDDSTAHSAKPVVAPDDGKYSRLDPLVEKPKVTRRVNPHYPEEARVARTQGAVVLEVRVGEDGSVDDVRVLQPLPNGLDEAAVEAVRQWKFQPAMKDGRAIPVVFELTISFRL